MDDRGEKDVPNGIIIAVLFFLALAFVGYLTIR
jgi:hypothetical protein